MKKILVVGGSGFIGSRYISKSDKVKIFNVYNKRPSKEALYNIQIADLEEAIKKINPDAIINFAVKYEYHGIEDIVNVNVKLTKKILKYCQIYGIRKFISLNSFFTKDGYFAYHVPNYSRSKKIQSRLLKTANIKGLSIIELFLEHIYGSEENDHKFVPFVGSRIMRNEDIVLKYPADLRDFLHVEDLIGLIRLIIEDKTEQGYSFYEAGTGRSVSVLDFVKTYIRLSGSGSKIIYEDISNSSGISTSFARRSSIYPGWKPEITLEEGIARLISHEY